jgi:hypothetical protein
MGPRLDAASGIDHRPNGGNFGVRHRAVFGEIRRSWIPRSQDVQPLSYENRQKM